ncbi:copper chaperone PCu(A)C [Sulfitobacter sp. HNIBRBA3233]|uniref:copper chaperone PCu(A)C n=1 Tax=Sulfitobacter marinivivus TaxID=3158558 RepID=UPI0032DE8A5C
MKTILSIATAALLSATALLAQEYRAGDISVDHPRSFEKPASGAVGVGYLTLTNTGSTDDALIGLRGESLERVEIHKSETDDMGVARMARQERIDIPAGETVILQPGGLHIMFMGLSGQEWAEGDRFEATLEFERAGPLAVAFNVEKRGSQGHGGTAHSTHGAMGGTAQD